MSLRASLITAVGIAALVIAGCSTDSPTGPGAIPDASYTATTDGSVAASGTGPAPAAVAAPTPARDQAPAPAPDQPAATSTLTPDTDVGGEVELSGAIESIALPALTVAGKVVLTNADTRVASGDERTTLADLVVGEVVEVDGWQQADNSVLAHEIDAKKDDGGSSGTGGSESRGGTSTGTASTSAPAPAAAVPAGPAPVGPAGTTPTS